jgi:transcriptional regulator with XRE-family HTH domain
MKEDQLGQEVRRLRLQSGTTLRGLAARLKISAAHLSDIERNRRRPSQKLLEAISRELRGAGATLEALEELVTGIDPEMRDWIASTPGVRRLLRKLKESGDGPAELLRMLERSIPPRAARSRKKTPARRA